MQVNPYLNFNGNCKEAFELYAKVLGGKIEMMQTHGESPMADKVPPDWKDAIVHARLKIGDDVLMASDAPPQDYYKPQGLFVTLTVDKPAEADRIFNALSENGTIIMPIQETFWAARFAMFSDRFGTPWMVSCDKPAT
jgi:PhnB protein